MFSMGKVVTTVLAADEAGHEKLYFPVLQALVFFLDRQGYSFPAYDFNPRSYSLMEGETRRLGPYPYSTELERDILHLVATEYLIEERSTPRFSPGPLAFDEKKEFIESFDRDVRALDKSYQKLVETIRGCLVDYRSFLRDCYMLYSRTSAAV